MRLLIQRVKEAKVLVDGKEVGAIGPGLLTLLGIHAQDTVHSIGYLAEKLVHCRIFPDKEGKMNLSVKDSGGGILIVSQFTLYADCTDGRRPSFIQAARPEVAKPLYETFLAAVRNLAPKVEVGVFGAYMQIELINDGPVTLLIEK